MSNREKKNTGPSGRLQRERHTIEVMIEVYCRAHHRPAEGLCPECRELHSYATQRVDKCPFRAAKPTCAKCSIHCYKAGMREQVRQVMRYSGPRMMIYYPLLALRHFIDQLTFKPPAKGNKRPPA